MRWKGLHVSDTDAGPPRRGGDMTARQWVAVVDDHESLRLSIVRLLRSVGVDARGFSSAEAFLEHAPDVPPACAVVDLYLGEGLNGYELKERLEHVGRALPMVFMTAHTELPIHMQEDQAAVANCLRKPFSMEELLARLAPRIDVLRDSR